MFAHIDDGGQGNFVCLASYLENDPALLWLKVAEGNGIIQSFTVT
jgi:hypothetical protein